ncbi:HAD family hydrolase [Kamptonema sp. UHCC 0994]|uniref:HAD family hydrolase n=1 Tax=Kamptonema sp. UHCC 0994 TaxID=3031329 RepID=UPI0023B89466|nr:HAD family hydrolase [Kamptonema sp. UHCC 0994]MDF0551532.1 HAD family hydrolase [Kamptonema sp. UHCC 0994]
MLRLITDFDGPIMDVSERYYRVYQLCLAQAQRPDQEIRVLPKQEFWQMKRSRTPETQIGILSGLDETQAAEFAQNRRKTVHTLPYLVYDQPVPGAVETLERLQQAGVDLVVMTMRRVRELDEAFNRCDLAKFFPLDRRYCLPNDYVKTGDTKDKPLLMAKAIAELPAASDVWMVGDTEADIIAAKTHGVKVMGALSGIRDRTQLEMHKPDLIVSNLVEAVDKLLTVNC